MKDDVKISSEAINERAKENYDVFNGFFNVEEEAWRSAVLELALETLGVDPKKLWEQYPQEHCCGKENGITPDHSDELSCQCCNGICVWCN